MSGLLSSIGSMAAMGSGMLVSPAVLRREGTEYAAAVMRQRITRPARAQQTGRSADARFRIDQNGTEVDPLQNDDLLFDGETWIVWRIFPSPAASHWMVEVMAEPAEAVGLISTTETSDGAGGVIESSEAPSETWNAYVHGLSASQAVKEHATEALHQLAVTYRPQDAPREVVIGDDLHVRGQSHAVVSISVDNENPAWSVAIVRRQT